MLQTARHTPHVFFMKPPNLQQAYCASTVFELSEDLKVLLKSTSVIWVSLPVGGQQPKRLMYYIVNDVDATKSSS